MARTVPIAPSPDVGELFAMLRKGLGVGVSQNVEFIAGQSYQLPDGRHSVYVGEELMGGASMLKFRIEVPVRPPANVWQPRDRVVRAILEARESSLSERLTITLRDHGSKLARVGTDHLPMVAQRICAWRTLHDAGIPSEESRWEAYIALVNRSVEGVEPKPGRAELRWVKGQPMVEIPPEVRRYAVALTAHAEGLREEPLRSFVIVTAQLLALIAAELERALRALVERQRGALRSNDPTKLTAFSRSGLQEVVRAPLLETSTLLKVVDILHHDGRGWHVADLVEPERGILRIVVRDALAEHPMPDTVGMEHLRHELDVLERLRVRLLKRFPDLTIERVVETCYEVRGAPARAAMRGAPAFVELLNRYGWKSATAAEALGIPTFLFRAHLRWLGVLTDLPPAELTSQWEALGEPVWSTFAAAVHVDAEIAQRRIARAVVERDLARVSKDLDERLDTLLREAVGRLYPDSRTTWHTFPFDAPQLAAALGIHRLTAEHILANYHLEERWSDLRPTTTREVDRVAESMPTEHRIREVLLRTHGELAPAAKALRMPPETLKRYIGRYGLWRFARRAHPDDA